jgi:hypothetical protein
MNLPEGVRPLEGESLRFHVDGANATYLVDLGANDGVGECNCENYNFRAGPKIRQGMFRGDFCCKHARRAADWLLRRIQLTLMERQKG